MLTTSSPLKSLDMLSGMSELVPIPPNSTNMRDQAKKLLGEYPNYNHVQTFEYSAVPGVAGAHKCFISYQFRLISS
jgi:hypothetical protein